MKQVPMTELIAIYNGLPFAPEFFAALAAITRSHAVTDVDRRRRDIIADTKKAISKTEAEAIFIRFEKLGMGKLVPKRGAGANTQFFWKDELNYVNMAQEVIMAAKQHTAGAGAPAHIGNVRTGNNTYVVKLSSGPMLKLSTRDIAELREFLSAIE